MVTALLDKDLPITAMVDFMDPKPRKGKVRMHMYLRMCVCVCMCVYAHTLALSPLANSRRQNPIRVDKCREHVTQVQGTCRNMPFIGLSFDP